MRINHTIPRFEYRIRRFAIGSSYANAGFRPIRHTASTTASIRDAAIPCPGYDARSGM